MRGDKLIVGGLERVWSVSAIHPVYPFLTADGRPRKVGGTEAAMTRTTVRWLGVAAVPGYGWLPADVQAGDNKSPAAAAATIGYLPARALIITVGGGRSEILGWSYNTAEQWTAHGLVKTHVEAVGEWSPLPVSESVE